jgi:hypothetical protein
MSSLSDYPDRRAVVGALAAVPALPSLFGLFGPTPARAQTQMTSVRASRSLYTATRGR